jgi:hypothetical protein
MTGSTALHGASLSSCKTRVLRSQREMDLQKHIDHIPYFQLLLFLLLDWTRWWRATWKVPREDSGSGHTSQSSGSGHTSQSSYDLHPGPWITPRRPTK